MVVRAYAARTASAALLLNCLVVRLTWFIVHTPRILVERLLLYECMLSDTNPAVTAADARSTQPISA